MGKKKETLFGADLSFDFSNFTQSPKLGLGKLKAPKLRAMKLPKASGGNWKPEKMPTMKLPKVGSARSTGFKLKKF